MKMLFPLRQRGTVPVIPLLLWFQLITLLLCVPVLLAQPVEDTPLIVEVDWLAAHLDDPGVVVIDARSPGEYIKDHIAGAVSLPSASTYQDNSATPYRVILQSALQELLGDLGIRRDAHVILYDGGEYLDAARVFWALQLYGHRNLSLLNGSYPAWRKSGLPVNNMLPAIEPTNYQATIQPDMITTRLQMLLALDDTHTGIVDSREAVEFEGRETRASRKGRIPTAKNIPKFSNLEDRQGLRYIKSRAALERLYRDLDDNRKIIAYCNIGRDAALTYIGLRMLGHNISIYDESWTGWADTNDLPVELAAP